MLFQDIYDPFEGENVKVLPSHMDLDNLKVMGYIITHVFIIDNIFPVKICSFALWKYGVPPTDEELFSTYLKYLPNRELEMTEIFSKGNSKV